MPLVSVIMSSYNNGQYLSESIESVLNQSFTDLELIVVDDASTDDSREIIREYGDWDARVRPAYHQSNQGIVRTMNDGIELSSGKYIAFLDSDDAWAGNKLEKQMEILAGDENLVVWTEGEIINKYGSPSGVRFTEAHNATRRKKSGDIFYELVKGNLILHSSVIFKKNNLPAVKFSAEPGYYSDHIFYLDLAGRFDFRFIDERLTKYRVHGKNLTMQSQKKRITDQITTNEIILRKYRADLSRQQLSRQLCLLGLSYSKVSRYRDSLGYVCQGIKAYPLNAYYLLLLSTSALKYHLYDKSGNRKDVFRRLADTG